jgi:hypothetical protein
MAELVNLRTVRKQRARDAARRQADAAAGRTGAGAAEAERVRALDELERRRLDGHRLDEPEA